MKSDIKTPPRPSSFINLFKRDSSTSKAASMDAGLRESSTTRAVGIAAGHRGSRTTRISSMASGHRDTRTNRTAGMSAGPRAVTMVTGHIIPHFKKPEKRPLLLECAPSQETGNKWVKRLRPKSSDSVPFSSKRSKTGENSYKVHAQNLLGIILNHEECGNYLSKCDLNKTPLLTQNGECAYEESKALSHWIRRWCCASRQAVPLRKVAASVLCEPEKSNEVHRTSEDRLLGIILNHEDCNNYSSKWDLNKTPLLTQNGECAYEESKAISHWIRRWCYDSRQAVPLRKVAASVLCEPEKPSDMHRTSEDRQVPSIKAMALMGSAAKKSITYRYKKKGSLLLWSM